MKFEMNGRTFEIKKVSENELWGDVGEHQKRNENYFGRFRPYSQEIWLSNELSDEQLKYTLMHELMHCYLWSYNCSFESLNEEDLCNLSANSHDIIHKIVENYFKYYKKSFIDLIMEK